MTFSASAQNTQNSSLGEQIAAELEHGTERAQKEWKEAWRLGIGLPPTAERYFCVYD
jgi:putative salt-induced outer membrane protein YdiY